MFKIWKRKDDQAFHFDRSKVISVISDAGVAREGFGDGRMLPLVIVDTSNRPDVVELMNAHNNGAPGDADSTWATLGDYPDHLALLLQFKKPFEIEALIPFELTQHGLTVDLAMRGKAMYLQAGKPGDRFYRNVEAPRIIIELGAELTTTEWEALWEKAIRNRLRVEGMSRSESRRLSPDVIRNARGIASSFKGMPSGLYVIPDEPGADPT